MVIEINIKQGVKETIVMEMTIMGSNVFDVRLWDIGLMSV